MTVTIKNLQGGIIADFVTDAKAGEGAEGQYSYSSGADLNRQGYQGYLSVPAVFADGAVSDAGGNFNSIVRGVTVNINVNAPGTGDVPVYYLTGGLSLTAPRLVFVVNDAVTGSHDITLVGAHATIDPQHNFNSLANPGPGFWGEDIALYTINGVPYAMYSWNDNFDGDIGSRNLNTAATIDDFLSGSVSGGAVLTTGVPHILHEGPTGKLYVTNGRYVGSIDGSAGATGSYDATDYDCGQGWIAVDLKSDKNSLVITMVRANTFSKYSFFGKSKVCYWDGVEDGLGTVYDKEDFFTSASFPFAQTMINFSRGKNGTTKMSTVLDKPIGEFPSVIYGAPPDPRSIDTYQKNLVWMPSDGFGPYVMQLTPKGGVHAAFLVSDGVNTATDVGMLKNIEGNKLYVAGIFNGVYRVIYFMGDSFNQGDTTIWVSRRYVLPYRSNIKKVRVYFAKLGEGGNALFSIFKNNDDIDPGGTKDLLNKSIEAGATMVDDIEYVKNIPNISAFYFTVTFVGEVVIERIEIDIDTREDE